MPKLYYDPRAPALEPGKRAVLHPKCAVVDRRAVFVSSANFPKAAQERNVELGLVLKSSQTAERITQFCDYLTASGGFTPFHWLQRRMPLRETLRRQPVAIRWPVYYGGILTTLLGAQWSVPGQFVYFRF